MLSAAPEKRGREKKKELRLTKSRCAPPGEEEEKRKERATRRRSSRLEARSGAPGAHRDGGGEREKKKREKEVRQNRCVSSRGKEKEEKKRGTELDHLDYEALLFCPYREREKRKKRKFFGVAS